MTKQKVEYVPKDRVRHVLNLPADLSRRLHQLTATSGSSMTQIITDALIAWLDRGAANELDSRYAMRLDRQTRAIERTQRYTVFIAEALGVLAQHHVTLAAHQLPFDEATAKLGQDRYESFLNLVARRIARGSIKIDLARESESSASETRIS